MKRTLQIIENLHRQYTGAVNEKCSVMLADRTEAEDARQEAYLQAYRGAI